MSVSLNTRVNSKYTFSQGTLSTLLLVIEIVGSSNSLITFELRASFNISSYVIPDSRSFVTNAIIRRLPSRFTLALARAASLIMGKELVFLEHTGSEVYWRALLSHEDNEIIFSLGEVVRKIYYLWAHSGSLDERFVYVIE